MRTIFRLLGLLGPYRFRVALAVLLGVATVAGNVGLLSTAAYVISAAAVVSYISLLTIPIYLVRFFSVSRSFSRYFERLVSHDLTFRLLGNLRSWFYVRLTPLAPALLEGYRSGDLLSRLVEDVEELENLYLRAVSPVLVAAVVWGLAFAVLYPFDPALAITVLVFLAAAGVGAPLLVWALSRGLGRRQLELRSELYSRIVEGTQGVQDLLAFGREEEQRRQIEVLNRKLGRIERRQALISGLQDSLGDLLTNLAMLVALVLAIPLVAGGEVRGVYLAFLALVALGVFEAATPLGGAFQTIGRTTAAGERLFEVSDSEPTIRNPKSPLPVPEDFTLRFDNVSFRYGEGDPFSLEDVSFALEPGRKVAVVGPSGSGKSTLANLILRFRDPQGGEIRLGGRSLSEYAQEDVRRLVSVVPQSTHAFNDTLRNNLLLADPEANDEALELALERARISSFIERLPDGLDTYVGEHGSRLSGGERRRLAVARALLKDAPLLVLDEPTANLDTVTELEVLASVWEAARDRAALLLTHRLVGMEEMHEILVMDAGRIVERGAHEQLLAAGGLYCRMLETQRELLVVPHAS
ncbi:MAG TPA: thiol reductant ABC exporter subunit CydC [Rubrobacter sp.]|nr:thiol reductant ABC exporter subunit CydC [Rubrobacter sp.]